MDLGANKTPVKVIKEGAFGSTYFRDIYSGVTEKWYKKSWKKFDQLKNFDKEYNCSDYYDVSVNKYGVKCGTQLRFWENKAGLTKQIHMVGFSGILDTGWAEDQKMMKGKLIDGKKS